MRSSAEAVRGFAAAKRVPHLEDRQRELLDFAVADVEWLLEMSGRARARC